MPHRVPLEIALVTKIGRLAGFQTVFMLGKLGEFGWSMLPAGKLLHHPYPRRSQQNKWKICQLTLDQPHSLTPPLKSLEMKKEY